jgi:hypothetical protein
MRPDEFHQHAAECVRHMDDQTVLVAAEVEDHAIVADEIDRGAELPLYGTGIAPTSLARQCEPCADRSFGLRVALPELFQCPAGDHLHGILISMSPVW